MTPILHAALLREVERETGCRVVTTRKRTGVTVPDVLDIGVSRDARTQLGRLVFEVSRALIQKHHADIDFADLTVTGVRWIRQQILASAFAVSWCARAGVDASAILSSCWQGMVVRAFCMPDDGFMLGGSMADDYVSRRLRYALFLAAKDLNVLTVDATKVPAPIGWEVNDG